MEDIKNKKTRFKKIVDEISHDLGIDKQMVRNVLTLLFKEIAITLILKGKPVLIRRFVKFVIALKGYNKIKEDLSKMKTKEK
jgi:nucleoid DNA-binding protein|tara:strand:+ start:1374 stop:1619 length:246 start_codon:yes stop_codon:yes gene_type:complete